MIVYRVKCVILSKNMQNNYDCVNLVVLVLVDYHFLLVDDYEFMIVFKGKI